VGQGRLTSRGRFIGLIAVASLTSLASAAVSQARPVPEPVRDQVFRASFELGIEALNDLDGSSVDVEVSGRYTRCPRPRVGLYACTLLVRAEIDGEVSDCRTVVAANRNRWTWKEFGCPTSWRP
jgi:hypothetical protein